jgi:hypothetical protein
MFCLLLLLAFFGESLSVNCLNGIYTTSSTPGSVTGCSSCGLFYGGESTVQSACLTETLQQCEDLYEASVKSSFVHIFPPFLLGFTKAICCDTNDCNDANLFQPTYSSILY